MNFEFSETEEATQTLARQILDDGTSLDRSLAIEADADGPGYDQALWKNLADANLLGVTLPEEWGGQGFSFLALCLMLEEAGRNLAPIPLFETMIYGALPIEHFGSDTLKQNLLPKISSGEALITAALFELGTSSLSRASKTTAIETTSSTEKSYTLTGTKTCVPFAAEANRVLVSASGDQGLGLFFISPNTPGIRLEPQQTTAHERQYVITLNDVRVNHEDVLAHPGGGEQVIDWLEPRASTALAAIAVGAAEEGLRQTAEYTRTRKQFGREIGSFQGVSLRAADAYIDVEAMRSTMWQAAWRADHRNAFQKAAAVAKWWACMGGHRVSHTCQHLHGGIGSDIHYPIHRFFLRLKHVAMTLGGANEQLSILGSLMTSEARAGVTAEDILS